MRRKLISALLLVVDAVIVATIPFLALLIRFEGNVDPLYYDSVVNYLPTIILVRLIVFYTFGLYRRLWRYASIHELILIISAVTLSSLILFVVSLGMNILIPRSIHFLSCFFNIAFIGASRLTIRVIYYFLHKAQSRECINLLIIGAGDAGAMIAREVTQRYYQEKRLIGFLDDSPYKINQHLLGAKVLGGRQDLSRVVEEYGVSEIIIAIPSVDGAILREIVRECKATKCTVKTVPGIYELIDGKVSVQQLRNVDLEDLLRREPVRLDMNDIVKYLAGKRVLVTGAGGSIGSELCRQVARMAPASLALLGKGENSIYEIDRELRDAYPMLAISPIIADIRDGERINKIFSEFKPQVVFHAAAHKHVPLMEAQPTEAVRNNIFGTKTVAEAADRAGTEVFVMISTDKAVNPTSVMGATKRVAELIIQNMSKISATKFVAVRFGNVLGSRGSVIPLFKKQIASGGPITITHPDMRRYFMTIPEASQLVLQAGAIAKGGEVFVLDMGEPVKILDMACDLIELSGLMPYKDINITFTGLRPGEKMFEEILTAEEGTMSTKHEKIYIARLKTVNKEILYHGLLKLEMTVKPDQIIDTLSKIVPTYKTARKQEGCLNLVSPGAGNVNVINLAK